MSDATLKQLADLDGHNTSLYEDNSEVLRLVEDVLKYKFGLEPKRKEVVSVELNESQSIAYHPVGDSYHPFLISQESQDVQSDVPAPVIRLSDPGDERTASERYSDTSLQTKERVAALAELVRNDPDEARKFVLCSLKDHGQTKELLPFVVSAAEELRFEKAEDQEVVWQQLLKIALGTRLLNDPLAEQTTWTAIRRSASLIPVENVEELLPLLDFQGAVDARLVTLQALKSIFEVEFAQLDAGSSIAERVFGFADLFTRRDALIPGEASAIASTAVQTLGTIAHPKFQEIIDQIVRLDMVWFSKIVLQSLKSILENSSEVGHPNCEAIKVAISSLESSLVERSQ